MAFQLVNGYDVEHASQLLVYDNLFPEIQHINGKGVTDTYTKTSDVESVTFIDVMRVLPYAPRFRKLGAANNGAWHNQKNEGGYNNAPQSTHYTIPIDLIYDEGIAITSAQIYSNPVELQKVVMAQLVKTAGLAINVITYAKQFEAFFRDCVSAAGVVSGTMVQGTAATPADQSGSYASAFIEANSALTEGIPQIGAFVVPMEERQAFVTAHFNSVMKRQYMQNASDAAAKILATGFINPFTNRESDRITTATGYLGFYDGVPMFLFNYVTESFVLSALGLDELETDDGKNADRVTAQGVIGKIQAMIVYGGGTCRGIVGPAVEANPNTYFGGVYILPKMKVGVEVLTGHSIVLVVDSMPTAAELTAAKGVIKFTPIDGVAVTGDPATHFGAGAFNDGTSN